MNQNTPLISVIMPSYHSAATVERAVLSVMRQTWENCELIVVENSSGDATPEIVGKLAEQYFYTDPSTGERHPRIRLIVQPNRGVSSARNTGIRAASGEYFVSLDADDYYEPETIARLYETLEETEADTVICGIRKVYEDAPEKNEDLAPGAEFSGDLRAFTDEMLTDLYDLHLISTHSNKIYRTELIRKHEIYYNEKLAVNEDIDFVLRYLTVCRRVSVITDIFLNYVQHKTGESLINTFQPHGLEGALLVLQSCDRLTQAAGTGDAAKQEMDERLFVHICSFAGLMYYRSDYSDEKKYDEIRKLCQNEDFQRLLGRMKADGWKNRAAAFLLKHRLAFFYHRMCLLLYRGYS